jgi:DNA-binding MarR family transcriptional regulator
MMAMQPTNVSVIVRALRERGFAQQTLNGTDLRSLLVSITPEGQKFLDNVLPSHWAYLERLMRGLGAPEREQLVELLQKLANSIRECQAEVRPVTAASRRGRTDGPA